MEALYRRGDLRLEYDASITRTAAEAFDARSGNCLALVMMTGAFAKAMGLALRYQAVLCDEAFGRAGDLAIEIGHVDLVESLVSGRTDDASWWAREAIRRHPELLGACVTLGVVYRIRQQPALAEAALARVDAREPDNTPALANRVLALRERRFDEARRLFEREAARAPDHHEFHVWLAVVHTELNDPRRAAEQLALAMRASTTRRDRDLYAAKLDRLESLTAQ